MKSPQKVIPNSPIDPLFSSMLSLGGKVDNNLQSINKNY